MYKNFTMVLFIKGSSWKTKKIMGWLFFLSVLNMHSGNYYCAINYPIFFFSQKVQVRNPRKDRLSCFHRIACQHSHIRYGVAVSCRPFCAGCPRGLLGGEVRLLTTALCLAWPYCVGFLPTWTLQAACLVTRSPSTGTKENKAESEPVLT